MKTSTQVPRHEEIMDDTPPKKPLRSQIADRLYITSNGAAEFIIGYTIIVGIVGLGVAGYWFDKGELPPAVFLWPSVPLSLLAIAGAASLAVSWWRDIP